MTNKPILNYLKKINYKLNLVREEVVLGTMDNTILALFLLILSLSISVVILGLSNQITSPIFLMAAFFGILLFWFISQAMVGFVDSIFFEERRFNNKINVITLTLAFLVFLILVVALPFFLIKLFPQLYPLEKPALGILIVIVYGTPILFWILIRPKIKKFFLRRFGGLFFEAIKKMKKDDQKKVLKEFEVSYKGLKTIANK